MANLWNDCRGDRIAELLARHLIKNTEAAEILSRHSGKKIAPQATETHMKDAGFISVFLPPDAPYSMSRKWWKRDRDIRYHLDLFSNDDIIRVRVRETMPIHSEFLYPATIQELAELTKVITEIQLKEEAYRHDNETSELRESLIDGVADVLVMFVGIIDKFGISQDDILRVIENKCRRYEGKEELQWEDF